MRSDDFEEFFVDLKAKEDADLRDLHIQLA